MATSIQMAFDSADPARLAAFWAAALHYIVPPPPDGFANENSSRTFSKFLAIPIHTRQQPKTISRPPLG